ncbi:gamma-glutamyltransferase [Paracoccus sp. NBH48]|uniref:gamma-glutamyltransferase n=1 Tax=Paracoccus sp. NBH48 TaxID=2596918 RepID=UPI0019D59D74|nr:gamma-glutamyltransferase [Paracoccus sp. NBH48]
MAAAAMQPMATSPHPLATLAGADVLQRGGTAAEAAVAMGAVLAVVMPHFCGLGGDAVWLMADRDGWATTLMGHRPGAGRPAGPARRVAPAGAGVDADDRLRRRQLGPCLAPVGVPMGRDDDAGGAAGACADPCARRVSAQ